MNEIVALPLRAGDIDRFRPEGAGSVYLIAVGSLFDRARWRREVAALGASYPSDETLTASLRAGIAQALAPDLRAGALADLDARSAASGDDLAAIELRLGAVERTIASSWPPYAALVADRMFWADAAPLVAFRMFLRGWENVETPFVREHGLASEAMLGAIPQDHVAAIGWCAISLMHLGETTRKN